MCHIPLEIMIGIFVVEENELFIEKIHLFIGETIYIYIDRYRYTYLCEGGLKIGKKVDDLSIILIG